MLKDLSLVFLNCQSLAKVLLLMKRIIWISFRDLLEVSPMVINRASGNLQVKLKTVYNVL